jgi:hypothetical protein
MRGGGGSVELKETLRLIHLACIYMVLKNWAAMLDVLGALWFQKILLSSRHSIA